MTRILFIGANFANKGAAAMLLSAWGTLKRLIPDASFTLLSGVPQIDSRECARYGIMHVDLRPLRGTAPRVARALHRLALSCCHRAGLDTREAMDPKTRAMADADVIVDVSGISFSTDLGDHTAIHASQNVLIAKLLGKPLVFYSQAMGPFDSWVSRALARLVLPKADMVTARGESTASYLRQIGVKRFHICADAAFRLDPAPPARVSEIMAAEGVDTDQRPVVGLVPNARILARCQSRSGHEQHGNIYTHAVTQLVEHLIREVNATVVFVIHAIGGPGDRYDDRQACQAIVERVSCAHRVRILSPDYTPGELKGIIGSLDILVGARFHSLVAAGSMGVPCAGIAWSHKYRELMSMLGLASYVVDYRTMTAERVIEVVDSLWENRVELSLMLQDRIPAMRASAWHNGELVRDVVASQQGR